MTTLRVGNSVKTRVSCMGVPPGMVGEIIEIDKNTCLVKFSSNTKWWYFDVDLESMKMSIL